MSTPYDAFLDHVKEVRALSQIAGLMSWDQEVMMPPGGAAARAEQMAALESAAHDRRTAPALGDLLQELREAELDSVSRRNVELARRDYERSVKVPSSLAAELARATSRAQIVWAKARETNRFADFAPELKTTIALKREEADCIRTGEETRYEALLNDFEPGMTVGVLQPLLEGMRPRLSALREAIAQSGVTQPALEGSFDVEKQMALARKISDVLNYDWHAGRLDLSIHPFSSGTGGDVRITTRLDPQNPLDCLYSTMHELGHALYEQGIPDELAMTPVGHHVSMGVHESQSRLWENQIGRSEAFCRWLQPQLAEAFPDVAVDTPEMLYRMVNRVETGFIRTEADEVHYNLHVLLRFELERELIAGELEVDDLEEEWNRRFERDFAIAVPDAKRGVLQDVHWAAGLFGYFPTYALGNIYAAQLNAAMRAELGDIDEAIANGETGAVLTWLRKNIHAKASLLPPEQTIEDAAGASVSAEPLLGYLEQKFGSLLEL